MNSSITRRQAMECCALLLAGARAGMSAATKTALRVGVAETAITPSWPTRLWGYDRSANPTSEGVLDDIYAKAIVFESGKTFLLVVADVGAIGLDLSRRIARRVREATGIPEDAVAIQVTHDHSAPAVLGIPMTAADTRFQQLLEDRIVSIATQAHRGLAPAVLELGQVDSSIGLNRRLGNRVNTWDKDSGPIDKTFSVLLIRQPSGGKYMGAIVNYATHPVTMRDNNNKVSADFPGVLYKRLGSELNCPVMYLQGCCGDVIPKVFGGVKEMESYGTRMADEALRAAAVAKPISGDSIDYQVRHIHLEFVAPYSLSDFQTKASEYATQKTVPREWAKVYLQYLEKGGAMQQAHETMVEAFRIGDLHIALLPGEVLHLTSLLIRSRFPGLKLMVGSYTNDTSTGYLPHAVEFPRGGYEVNTAWELYGILKTTPEMEQSVRETAIELLRATAGAG
ncbi:MAG TPA: neutral/alkaline non-lysosomal ceramidase N-terminal domain-containing protein [Bryobacteraceae bacterium]|nr:neutral/alkaline non-lysosomal ceramidase N-terminal domain-containing protein [Bryobacteraceae bacterium]